MFQTKNIEKTISTMGREETLLLLSLILKLIERYKSLIRVFSTKSLGMSHVLAIKIHPVMLNKQEKPIITPEISCCLLINNLY